MASSKPAENGWVVFSIMIAFGASVFFFHSMGSGATPHPFGVAMLSLVKAATVGWGDFFYAFIFDNPEAAQRNFGRATLVGQRNFPMWSFIATAIGTLISIGGLIAIGAATSATSAGEAFRIGFFAEIAEGVIFNLGYYATTQTSGLSVFEVVFTLIAGLVTGCICMTVRKG